MPVALGDDAGPSALTNCQKKTLRKKLKMILATAQISFMSVHFLLEKAAVPADSVAAQISLMSVPFLLEKAAVPADSVSRFIMAATNKEC